jgi:hypothetical protein
LLGSPATHLEFPPRLAARFWQDQGRIYDRAGQHGTARHCYEWAAMYHPLTTFFPLSGHGDRLHRYAPGYFVGYGQFFVCGDRRSYDRDAANVVAGRTRAGANLAN